MSILGTDAEQSGEHDGKEGATEPYATGKMFLLFFFLLRLFRGGGKGVKVTELTRMRGWGGVAGLARW